MKSLTFVVLAVAVLGLASAEESRSSFAQQSVGSSSARRQSLPRRPTCDNVRCEGGKVCELVQVQCIRAPCYPIPTCKDAPPAAHTCATTLCAPGTICVERPVQCIRAPCPAIVECVPQEGLTNTCMNVRCSSGHHCVMIQPQCFTTPCPPYPQCVAD